MSDPVETIREALDASPTLRDMRRGNALAALATLEQEITKLREALREIAAGPYNGFEQCKAIARAALAEPKAGPDA